MEVSAKTGENVANAFMKMGELLLEEYLPNRVTERHRYSLTSNYSSISKQQKKNC
jgi:hypothetical protein